MRILDPLGLRLALLEILHGVEAEDEDAPVATHKRNALAVRGEAKAADHVGVDWDARSLLECLKVVDTQLGEARVGGDGARSKQPPIGAEHKARANGKHAKAVGEVHAVVVLRVNDSNGLALLQPAQRHEAPVGGDAQLSDVEVDRAGQHLPKLLEIVHRNAPELVVVAVEKQLVVLVDKACLDGVQGLCRNDSKRREAPHNHTAVA